MKTIYLRSKYYGGKERINELTEKILYEMRKSFYLYFYYHLYTTNHFEDWDYSNLLEKFLTVFFIGNDFMELSC